VGEQAATHEVARIQLAPDSATPWRAMSATHLASRPRGHPRDLDGRGLALPAKVGIVCQACGVASFRYVNL
jgi:hypothetical protein